MRVEIWGILLKENVDYIATDKRLILINSPLMNELNKLKLSTVDKKKKRSKTSR